MLETQRVIRQNLYLEGQKPTRILSNLLQDIVNSTV